MTPRRLYHGTIVPGIVEVQPRKRYTPGWASAEDVPPAIYATDDPAYAAGHAFPWRSSEGIDLFYENGKLILLVPERHTGRLDQEVYIYELPPDSFELLEYVSPIGRNYRSLEGVRPLGVERFESVRVAVERHGGEVRIAK